MANRYKFIDWKRRNCQSCVQYYTMSFARLAWEFLPLTKLAVMYPPVTSCNYTISLINCVYEQFMLLSCHQEMSLTM